MSDGAAGTIIVSMMVIGGSGLIRDAAQGMPADMAGVVNTFLLGSALMLIAFVSPELARMLAIMGAIGAIMARGLPVLGALKFKEGN